MTTKKTQQATSAFDKASFPYPDSLPGQARGVNTQTAAAESGVTYYKITPFGMRKRDDETDEDDGGSGGGLSPDNLRQIERTITQEIVSHVKEGLRIGPRIPDPFDPNTQGDENGLMSHPKLANANGSASNVRNSNVASNNSDAQEKASNDPNLKPSPAPGLSNSAGLSATPTLTAPGGK